LLWTALTCMYLLAHSFVEWSFRDLKTQGASRQSNKRRICLIVLLGLPIHWMDNKRKRNRGEIPPPSSYGTLWARLANQSNPNIPSVCLSVKGASTKGGDKRARTQTAANQQTQQQQQQPQTPNAPSKVLHCKGSSGQMDLYTQTLKWNEMTELRW
jgi:hypothetical protein